MKKRLLFALVGLFCCSILSVTAEANYMELYEKGYTTLSKDNRSQEIDWFSNSIHNGVLAFDYWYEPDPVLLKYARDSQTTMVTESIRLYTPAMVPGTTVWYYKPSKTWETTVVNVPYLFSKMTMDTYSLGGGYMDMCSMNLPPEEVARLGLDYVVDNKMHIKNLKFYDSFSDYLADGSRGQGSSDQPVPEPGTVMMLGTSMLGLIGFEIRRRKHSA